MLNRVIIMGRITKDLQLQQTPQGVPVTSFTVACDRNFTDKNGHMECDFITVVAWRSVAEFICRNFFKGRMIAVDGYIQTRNFEDKQGNKRMIFEVIAESVYFADSKKKDEDFEMIE